MELPLSPSGAASCRVIRLTNIWAELGRCLGKQWPVPAGKFCLHRMDTSACQPWHPALRGLPFTHTVLSAQLPLLFSSSAHFS